MNLNLTDIGLTPETLQQRVVESIVDSILHDRYTDEDGNVSTSYTSRFKEAANKEIVKATDAAVAKMVTDYMATNIETVLATTIFAPTNGYGEPKGVPRSFREYIVNQITEYMNEQVDEKGAPKPKGYSYNWKSECTRAMWMVDACVKKNLQDAIRETLASANASIAESITETVRKETEKLKKICTGLAPKRAGTPEE
jgi:hypothetical protein